VPTCRSCGAEIRWARTQAGKAIPLDAGTRFEGNLVETGEYVDGTPVVRVVGKDEERGKKLLYKSHFATCRDADKWRKK
jgi:hypothetical protein